jgi:hypothetical protein
MKTIENRLRLKRLATVNESEGVFVCAMFEIYE